jgi:hypothetical protein
MFSVTLPPFYLCTLKPTEQEAEWVPEPCWDEIKKRNFCAPAWNKIPIPLQSNPQQDTCTDRLKYVSSEAVSTFQRCKS